MRLRLVEPIDCQFLRRELDIGAQTELDCRRQFFGAPLPPIGVAMLSPECDPQRNDYHLLDWPSDDEPNYPAGLEPQ